MCMWWPRPKSRRERLPAPGAERGASQSQGSGGKKKLNERQSQNEVKLKWCDPVLPRGRRWPTTPHSGCLWGGVQAPNESGDTSPPGRNAAATKYHNMPRWGRRTKKREEWRGKRV